MGGKRVHEVLVCKCVVGLLVHNVAPLGRNVVLVGHNVGLVVCMCGVDLLVHNVVLVGQNVVVGRAQNQEFQISNPPKYQKEVS